MSPGLVTTLSMPTAADVAPAAEDLSPLGPGGLACYGVPAADVAQAAARLSGGHGFTRLGCLTAVDTSQSLEMVYVLERPDDRSQLVLKSALGYDDPRVPTLTSVWPGADWLEREVYDLFGVTFEGHPHLRRLLLTDDFKGHPLLKSFGRAEDSDEAKDPGLAAHAVATLATARASGRLSATGEATPEDLEAWAHGSAGLRTERIILNMGPQHPSTHGVLHVLLALEGEVVTASEPSIGYLHRCIEKLSESRTYKQCVSLMDRSDYVSGFHTELAMLEAAEELGGIHVPRKAEYLRVLMCELVRIASHLVWVGTYGLDLGALTPFLYCFKEREQLLDLLEAATGGRMMFNYFRVGGVKEDLPPGLAAGLRDFLTGFDKAVDGYESMLTTNEIFYQRTKGVSPMTPEQADAFGVTGPMRRAAGVAEDLRRDAPYSAYGEFDVRVPTGRTGDCYDRYLVRIAELREAGRIALAALDGMPEGEHMGDAPRVFKPPAGEAYRRVESPRGELGIYLVSDGTTQPWRLKIRSPALSNLHVMPALLEGLRMGDVVATVGSIDVVLGEIDR
jgi:NADH:ubiquinone oxidoreductase subunit D/NADH:ubiquinone oxidoreductase subunit C